MTCVISHNESFISVDWAAMREVDSLSAAGALEALLRGLDAIEEQVFVARGMAGIIIEDRLLWATLNYASFDKCLKGLCPKSWPYIRDAMRTVRELRDIPLSELLQIKRCNLIQMKYLPSRERQNPDVLEAAKMATEEGFATFTQQRYPDLHLESKRKLLLTFTMSDYEMVCAFLDEACAGLGIEDRAGQIVYLAIDWHRERDQEEAVSK